MLIALFALCFGIIFAHRIMDGDVNYFPHFLAMLITVDVCVTGLGVIAND